MIAKTAKQSLKLTKKRYPMSRRRGCSRLIASTIDEAGKEKVVYRGPTRFALRKQHALGLCDAFCGFCVWDAEQWLKSNTL